MAYTLTYNLIDNDTHYEVSGYIGEPINVVVPSEYEGKAVTSIGSYAFYYCTSLTSVVIPNSVISISDGAFYNCNNLTKVNYLGTIDGWAQIDFDNNNNSNPVYYARSLYINNQLVTEANITSTTKINDWAFEYCTSLTSVVIGDSVTSIGKGAFWGCYSLTSVVMGNSITGVGQQAFNLCNSLTNVIIGDSVIGIGKKAFSNCTSLTSILIPNSVTNIYTAAFDNCVNLTTITLLPKTPPTLASTDFNENAKFYCYSSVLEAYKTATNWNTYANSFHGNDMKICFIQGAMAQKQYFATKEEVKDLEDKISTGSGLTEVDSELSTESENPVQNKVITGAINSSHVVNVTQMSTIYDNESELPNLGASGNGACYLVKTNGELPLVLYSYNASDNKWVKKFEVKPSTLYLNLEDGSLYRYTNNPNTIPYSNFIKITLSPEVIESKIGDIELALDSIIEIQNSLIGGAK